MVTMLSSSVEDSRVLLPDIARALNTSVQESCLPQQVHPRYW